VVGGEPQQRSEAVSGYAEDRARLVAAFGKAAAEHGYAGLTVEQVMSYAGVPRGIFDAHFGTKEQGLVAAQEAFIERLWLDAVHACEESAAWPVKVRAGIAAVLASVVEASALARVFAVEASSASLAAAERQFAALDEFAELLRGGRRDYPAAAGLPASMERALVGGIASIVSAHLLMEDPQAIPSLERELVELVLIPYLGETEARRVAVGQRPAP
jgi:AcrR family transcriptional regulator